MAATTDNPAGLTCPELRKAERAAEATNKKRRLCSVLTHLDANAACNAAPAAGNTTLCVVCQQHVPVLQASLAQQQQQQRELRAHSCSRWKPRASPRSSSCSRSWRARGRS